MNLRQDALKRLIKDNVPRESCEYFFSDSYGYDNGYFDDIDSLEDYCKDNDVEMPKYIWGTYKKELSMDAESIVSNQLEEWYEDAFDSVDGNELSLLQAVLDDFCKNCGVGCCYEVDYKVCVVLRQESEQF